MIDNVNPTFNGTLPTSEITVEEGKVPAQAVLTVSDNCSTNVLVTPTKHETTENGNRIIIYKWEAKDECGNKTEHTQKVKISADKKDKNPNRLIIYPNPITEFVHLNLNEKVSHIKIFDTSGRLIKTLSGEKDNIYSISSISRGSYILVVKTQSDVLNFKIIKQ